MRERYFFTDTCPEDSSKGSPIWPMRLQTWTTPSKTTTVDGKKYAVYIGKGVSLAHQSQVHGPASIGDHTLVGMQSPVFKSVVGKNVVIEPGPRSSA